MPLLLDLSRELRDKILSLVISAHFSPQPLSLDVHNIQDMRWNRRGLKYTNFIRTDIVPTLLVNRQLSAETLAAIALIHERHNYALDALVFEESELRVTWLSVPVLTTKVDKIRTTFRIEGISKTRFSAFTIGDASPGSMTYYLFDLLERFLKVGPVNCNESDLDRSISIQTLELDVRTPNVPYEMIQPTPESHDHSYDGLVNQRKVAGIDYIMRPETFAAYLWYDIRGLVGMTYHTAEYGRILYDRVGNIKITIDGEHYAEFDLAKLLALLEFNDSFGRHPREKREGVFNQWKADAYKKRKELGLPVLEIDEVEADMRSK